MTKNKEQDFYKCYSFRLRRFIEAHNIYPVSSGVHPVTNRVYYLFVMTDELSRILTNWTNNKNKINKND